MIPVKSSHLRRLDRLYRACLLPVLPLLALLGPAQALPAAEAGAPAARPAAVGSLPS